ncbi:ATP-binding cassette domain-containing protein, partial [Haploplasma axanthum]
RAKNIGFVFQNYNVIDSYTVYQNVVIALEAQGYDPKKKKARALELIEKVGLLSHKNQKTAKLSGGQKQRVVIARALAKNAPIILADEPTGNLDSKSGREIMELLKEISKDKLIILVTHNYEEAKNYITRNIVMSDGNVKEDKVLVKEKSNYHSEENQDNVKTSTIKKASQVALRNIISMPKRTIFSCIVMMITISMFIFFYSTLMKNYVNEALNIASEFTVYVQSRENEVLTKEEINEIKNKYANNETLITPSLYENIIFNDGINRYTISDSTILLDKEYKGSAPKNQDEVVVSQRYRNNEPTYKIGDTIKLFYSADSKDYKIVGILEDNFRNISKIYVYNSILYDADYQPTDFVKSILNQYSNKEETFQISELAIKGNDRQSIVLASEKLINDGYRVIDRYLILENQMKFVKGTVIFFMAILVLAITSIIFLLTYHVQKNMMESRKKDFAVYRSIGISEKEVGIILLFEQFMIAVISTILTFILLNILSGQFLVVRNITRNITTVDYIIISLAFVLLTLRQGFKFNRKIFNVTVIESLKEDF